MTEVGAWIVAELEAQRKFVHGIVCVLCAIALRWRGVVSPGDSTALSKAAFQFFFPAFLLAKISKTPISPDLTNLALTSLCVHLLLATLIVFLSRFVSKQHGFRGQWSYSMMGCNVAFAYPLVLASEELAKTVFPGLVVWDICGNLLINLVVNQSVAIYHSPAADPAEEDLQPAVNQEPAATVPTSSVIGAGVVADDHAPADDDSSISLDSVSIDVDTPRQPPTRQDTATAVMATLGTVETGVIRHQASIIGKRKARSGHTYRAAIKKVATNIVLMATALAIIINLSGLRLPFVVDDCLESLGQPFSMLFFFLVGLNMVWSVIRPYLRVVLATLVSRMLVIGSIAALIWYTPLPLDKASRQAAIIGLSCPMSGMTMSYTIDFGYNRALQAALVTGTNMLALLLLFCLISGGG